MTIEEKAKAYDEALERARKIHDEIVNNEVIGFPGQITEIFPELRDSEDERIRRNICTWLKHKRETCTYPTPKKETLSAWIAYLEEMPKMQGPVNLDDDIEVGLDRALQIVKDAKGSLPGYQTDDGIYECYHAIRTLERILKNGIEQKPAEKQDYSGLNDLERAIHRGFLCAGVENVPITIIKETANECKRTQTIANENANAEWSEFDKGTLEDAICACDILWNDESFNKRSPNLAKAFGAARDWLKSLRPQPHWKPSGEQMGALSWMLENARENIDFDPLKDLYEQLKKLM